MAFSAGASNVANAVAPFVGGGEIFIDVGIVLGTVAIGTGAFTIARRTLDTVGGGITDLPLLASLVVMVIAATITTVLSRSGIPISLAVTALMTIIGLSWGRATWVARAQDIVTREEDVPISSRALNIDTSNSPPEMGEEDPDDIRSAAELYNPQAVARVVTLLIISSSAAALLSYGLFITLPFLG